MFDPHNYQRRLLGAIRIVKSSDVSEKNKELILRFKDDCLLQLSTGRVVRYVQNLRKLAEWFRKDFDDVTENDVKVVIAKLNNSNYSEWTKKFYKVTLRKFFKWLKNTEEYPDEVKWLRITIKNNRKKLPEDLLTEDEVKKLINVARNARDRALVSVLYESGCRVGELLSLKIKNINFDTYGAKIIVNGKTGPRRIRIITTSAYLLDWINKHPFKSDPEYPLWVTFKGKRQICYGAVRKILRDLKQNANITKKVNPHNFRHSRATHLANHLTEAQMKELFGWTQSSDMASVYVHLSGRDVDNALLKVYGIENNGEKEESKFRPKNCIRCSYANPPTNRLCGKCGMVLDEKVAMNIIRKGSEKITADNILNELMKDDEFREILERKVIQLRNS